jgi:hypothetical protein
VKPIVWSSRKRKVLPLPKRLVFFGFAGGGGASAQEKSSPVCGFGVRRSYWSGGGEFVRDEVWVVEDEDDVILGADLVVRPDDVGVFIGLVEPELHVVWGAVLDKDATAVCLIAGAEVGLEVLLGVFKAVEEFLEGGSTGLIFAFFPEGDEEAFLFGGGGKGF